MFNPGLVYSAGIGDYFGFLCDAAPAAFEADADADAFCDDLSATGFAVDARDLNDPSISVGELVVAPDRFTLNPGATATVSVGWAGLTPGARFIGSVSHADVTGIIGLTLITVDA